MCVPLLTICKKYLPIFILPYPISKWFITIVDEQFYSYLTTYLVVIPNFFLSFHQTLWLGQILCIFFFSLFLFRATRSSATWGIYIFLIFEFINLSFIVTGVKFFCEYIFIAFKLLIEENRRIRRIMFTFNYERGTSKSCWFDYHHLRSNADQTIQRCLASDIPRTSNL